MHRRGRRELAVLDSLGRPWIALSGYRHRRRVDCGRGAAVIRVYWRAAGNSFETIHGCREMKKRFQGDVQEKRWRQSKLYLYIAAGS